MSTSLLSRRESTFLVVVPFFIFMEAIINKSAYYMLFSHSDAPSPFRQSIQTMKKLTSQTPPNSILSPPIIHQDPPNPNPTLILLRVERPSDILLHHPPFHLHPRRNSLEPDLVLQLPHETLRAHQRLPLALRGAMGLLRRRREGRAPARRLLRGLGDQRHWRDRQGAGWELGSGRLKGEGGE